VIGYSFPEDRNGLSGERHDVRFAHLHPLGGNCTRRLLGI